MEYVRIWLVGLHFSWVTAGTEFGNLQGFRLYNGSIKMVGHICHVNGVQLARCKGVLNESEKRRNILPKRPCWSRIDRSPIFDRLPGQPLRLFKYPGGRYYGPGNGLKWLAYAE